MKTRNWSIIGAGGVIATAVAVYAGAETIGFKIDRPAWKSEVEHNAEQIQTTARSLAWLQLENYERLIKRGVQLSRRDCARYRALAKSLGVTPLRC